MSPIYFYQKYSTPCLTVTNTIENYQIILKLLGYKQIHAALLLLLNSASHLLFKSRQPVKWTAPPTPRPETKLPCYLLPDFHRSKLQKVSLHRWITQCVHLQSRIVKTKAHFCVSSLSNDQTHCLNSYKIGSNWWGNTLKSGHTVAT